MTENRRSLMLKSVLVGLGLLVGCMSFAEIIPEPWPEAPQGIVDYVEDPHNEKIACGNILEEMDLLAELSAENGSVIAEFLLTISDMMSKDWYRKVRRYQGKTVVFPDDHFQGLKETAEVTEEVSGLAFENSEQLKERIQKIRDSLELCL